MSTQATYVEGLSRHHSAPATFGLERVLEVIRMMHEVFVEAQDMARAAHRRNPHLD